jgi:uncharacterized membrane protein YhaH (DUF805 family)
MRKYLGALLSPFGRLPAIDYACTVIPLFMLTFFVRAKLLQIEDPSQFLQAGALILVWMKFCLTSRRLQDMNYLGVICFPFFAAIAIKLLIDFNPDMIDEEGAFDFLLFIAQKASGIGMMCLVGCGGLVFGESSVGSNLYGPPFDMPDKKYAERDTASAHAARRMQGSVSSVSRQVAAESTKAVNTSPRSATPQRLQGGFGRR